MTRFYVMMHLYMHAPSVYRMVFKFEVIDFQNDYVHGIYTLFLFFKFRVIAVYI
jgi:hypothetical protein